MSASPFIARPYMRPGDVVEAALTLKAEGKSVCVRWLEPEGRPMAEHGIYRIHDVVDLKIIFAEGDESTWILRIPGVRTITATIDCSVCNEAGK